MSDQPTLITEPTDIRFIVIDVDNTLLNSKHELSERNANAVKAAMAKGVRVTLSTGKTHTACVSFIEQLGLKEPGVYNQGLVIAEANGAIRHQQTLDANIARQVITFAEDRGYAVIAYVQGRLLSRSQNPYVDEIHTKWREAKPEYVGPLQNLLMGTPINKMVIVSAHDERKIKALRWQLQSQLNGSARLVSGGVSHMLEVLPPGSSKGNALKSLLKELKIDPNHVMAIGDAENDLEMIQAAGVGVAVANAQQVLKDAADEITASNDEDGVAQVIEKYVLNEPEPAPEAAPESAEQADSPPDSEPVAPRPEDTPIEE